MPQFVDTESLLSAPWRHLGYRTTFHDGQRPDFPPEKDRGWPVILPRNFQWESDTMFVLRFNDRLCTEYPLNELQQIERFATGNLDKIVVLHWEIDLSTVYSGDLRLVYFPSHSYDMLWKIKSTQAQWQDLLLKPRTRKWQCLNGRAAHHRRTALSLLDHRDGIVSLGNEIPLTIRPYSEYVNDTNDSNWLHLLPIYSDCDINIVTETQYESLGIVSEKTLMAFLALQVPIVIGHRGIIRECQRMGFDMFEDIVDLSYDDLPNDCRLFEAINRNRRLLEQGIDRQSLMPRLLKNQQYVLDQWPRKLVRDYQQRVIEIHDDLTKHASLRT